MGYSATKDALDTLGLLRHTFTDGATGTGLAIGGKTYFYEVGQEQANGRITDTLYENTTPGFCRAVGSFRIASIGSVVRFPRLTRDQRIVLKIRFEELRRTDPMKLSSYSYGVI